MRITRRQIRGIIRESLISEQTMWHSTAPKNVEAILSQGLHPGRESANTMGGAWADEFYGKRPVYLSVEKGKYEGTPLAVNAANLDLVADLPTLVDTGAYQEEEGMYWDEGKEPQQMSNLIDEDGMVYFEDLLSPGSAEAQAAIEITGTAAVIDGVPPESIATEESGLKSNKPSAAESEWASKSQAEKDAHVKNAVWETMAWKRYRKYAQAEGIPFDPDDEEDMKIARAWWAEQPESKQFESRIRVTKGQLRRIIRESLKEGHGGYREYGEDEIPPVVSRAGSMGETQPMRVDPKEIQQTIADIADEPVFRNAKAEDIAEAAMDQLGELSDEAYNIAWRIAKDMGFPA